MSSINKKRLRNRLNKLPSIECPQIKEAWDNRRSTRNNLLNMGLAYDPNKVIKMPDSTKDVLLKSIEKSGENYKNTKTIIPTKPYVAKSLEEDAKHPRVRLFRLPKNEVSFATYMLDKYGDDYKAMARDRKNHYQLTSNQIRAKINRFKSVPEQYAEYLVTKGEIVLDDPTPLGKIKPPPVYVEPSKPSSKKLKKKKKTSLLKSVWEEESILEDKFCDNLTEESEKDDKSENTVKSKKLQLFSDDDDESDNEAFGMNIDEDKDEDEDSTEGENEDSSEGENNDSENDDDNNDNHDDDDDAEDIILDNFKY
ncbi:hypothetical protein TKK_0005452 [Trichogramma kaykai]|uniref:Nucleolar protein 16 n=1 Tax=Trichogramma kaykai TaxID=54128 RepID=A0ABD2XHN6_9HYME